MNLNPLGQHRHTTKIFLALEDTRNFSGQHLRVPPLLFCFQGLLAFPLFRTLEHTETQAETDTHMPDTEMKAQTPPKTTQRTTQMELSSPCYPNVTCSSRSPTSRGKPKASKQKNLRTAPTRRSSTQTPCGPSRRGTAKVLISRHAVVPPWRTPSCPLPPDLSAGQTL